jgi:tetratricopeptide (TPR) repeat protein
MSKIALNMIVKDDTEESTLIRALNSVSKYVDAIYITGTKEPQRRIKKVCKKFNAHWSWFPWIKDFSAARNFAMSQVPKEYEWIFWMDTDDVVMGAENFKDAIEKAEAGNMKAIFARYLYQVELDEKGNIKQILIEHLRERIIRNDGSFKWVAPIHETLIEQVPTGKFDYSGFVVVHLITGEEMLNSMYRNIEILEAEVIRNPADPRPIYYLAKAYFDTRAQELLYDSAGPGLESITIELIKDYIRKSGWAEERSQAWEYLSMVYREMQDYKKGITCLLEALTENPLFTSVYIQLALCYVQLQDWVKALHWIKLAGKVEIPKTTLVVNPRDYKSMMLEALFHIYLNTGQLELCQKVATELNKVLPNDINKSRVEQIDDLKHRNDMAHWTLQLATHLRDTGQTEQLINLIQAIPTEIAGEPMLVDLRNSYLPPRKWESNEIMLYCGPHFEQWSPKSVNGGIGGSEEAVIYLTREMAKLGWKVTVYSDPREDAGIYDGVTYLPHFHINWKDEFNVIIAWRQIQLVDVPNLKAKKIYLWNHDLQASLTYTPERVAKLTKAMFLSKFHRDNVPDLPEDKVFMTTNGINI